MDPEEDMAEKKISSPRSCRAAIHDGNNMASGVTIRCHGNGSDIGGYKLSEGRQAEGVIVAVQECLASPGSANAVNVLFMWVHSRARAVFNNDTAQQPMRGKSIGQIVAIKLLYNTMLLGHMNFQNSFS